MYYLDYPIIYFAEDNLVVKNFIIGMCLRIPLYLIISCEFKTFLITVCIKNC